MPEKFFSEGSANRDEQPLGKIKFNRPAPPPEIAAAEPVPAIEAPEKGNDPEKMVRAAESLEQLMWVIESVGPVTGSLKTYAKGELMANIIAFAEDPKNETKRMAITNTYGLRDQATKFVNDQQINTAQMRMPPSLISEYLRTSQIDTKARPMTEEQPNSSGKEMPNNNPKPILGGLWHRLTGK
jgi:hypothetical protein